MNPRGMTNPIQSELKLIFHKWYEPNKIYPYCDLSLNYQGKVVTNYEKF